MKSVDTKPAIRDLRTIADRIGIEVTVVAGRGKGAHQALLFRDTKSNETVSITISTKSSITPGVQRALLRYLAGMEAFS